MKNIGFLYLLLLVILFVVHIVFKGYIIIFYFYILEAYSTREALLFSICQREHIIYECGYYFPIPPLRRDYIFQNEDETIKRIIKFLVYIFIYMGTSLIWLRPYIRLRPYFLPPLEGIS